MYARVRDLREDGDWTQAQIAAILHIHQTTYSDYELGKLDIPTEALMQLADFHKTSVDFLLGRTDKREPYPRSV
jgi:transcriptional regulator with XRE-family HTH domain